MAKELINFNLTGALAERLLFIEKQLTKPGSVVPARAVVVKALMGYDPNQLLQGGEREYFGSGDLGAFSEPDKKPRTRVVLSGSGKQVR